VHVSPAPQSCRRARYYLLVEPDRPVNPFSYLEHNAQVAPDGAFVTTSKQTITNAEALINVKRIAYELRRLGVKPGDMIALNLPEVLTLLFVEAALHEAAASTSLPPGYDPDGAFPVDWFITSTTGDAAPSGSRVITVDDAFLALIEQNPYGIRPLDFASSDSLLWVMYSSGTTGKPSALPALLGNIEGYGRSAREPWMRDGSYLSFLPAKTPTGLFGFLTSVRQGVAFLAVGDNVPAETVELIARNNVLSLVISPAQVASFVRELESTGRSLPQIRSVYAVGMAMSPELSARLRSATDGCEIFSVYGSTEARTAALRNYETDDPFDVGQIIPGAEIQIVDDDGTVLPDGEVGRIRHRSEFMNHEYLGDPEGSAASWIDGWFYPGDLGSIRPDNGLTLAGRASEIINAGGVKVNPVRLDQFATKHSGVLDAAGFGYETADGILQVGIALVTEDDFDVQALIREFETEFGPAAPRLVARIDAIPRNQMGKPLRRELADRYRKS
jgi:long-chain acyl-CoA synthetase